MQALALIVAAGLAWWYYRNRDEGMPALPPSSSDTPSPVTSSVFTYRGSVYRVMGPAGPDGLVPVQQQAQPGMMVAQVIRYWDPITETITSGAAFVE